MRAWAQRLAHAQDATPAPLHMPNTRNDRTTDEIALLVAKLSEAHELRQAGRQIPPDPARSHPIPPDPIRSHRRLTSSGRRIARSRQIPSDPIRSHRIFPDLTHPPAHRRSHQIPPPGCRLLTRPSCSSAPRRSASHPKPAGSRFANSRPRPKRALPLQLVRRVRPLLVQWVRREMSTREEMRRVHGSRLLSRKTTK